MRRRGSRSRSNFPIRPGLVMMNAANLCPTHYPVLESVFGLTRDLDSDVSFQNRAKFAATKDEARSRLAQYVGAGPDEIAITRNTSEGNNIIVNGLDLGAGDEVLIWGENHPSNHIAWTMRAQRRGFTVRQVETPAGADTAEAFTEQFLGNLTPRTRVLAVSHVSNVTGIGLPMKSLCRACRDRNVMTLVDGAQTLGALNLDLHDMACDFFTGSLHKWPMGPKETGLLYVRSGSAERVWPTVVSLGYEAAADNGAQKFESFGQRDDSAMAAITPAVDFLDSIGKGEGRGPASCTHRPAAAAESRRSPVRPFSRHRILPSAPVSWFSACPGSTAMMPSPGFIEILASAARRQRLSTACG